MRGATMSALPRGKGRPMETALPADCGNAPRVGIVGDFVAGWAEGNLEAASELLADDVRWTLVGAATGIGTDGIPSVLPPFSPDRLVILSIVTHGRLASCDGYLEAARKRVGFSHAIRFAGASKTAKIAEVRSYCIDLRSDD